VIYQFFARAFLLAEYSTAITIVTEEFPAGRRGRALGVLTSLGALGLPVVALVHLITRGDPESWRLLYLIGLIPLVLVGFLRTKLKETDRWLAARGSRSETFRDRLRRVLMEANRANLLKVGFLFFFTTLVLLAAATWWPFHASVQLGLSDARIAALLGVAYPLGASGYYTAGRLQDRWGRKTTGTVFIMLGSFFGIAVFQIRSPVLLFPAMIAGVFFGFGINPVLAAVASELFPTSIRATAVGLVRSVFGTLGGLTGQIAVGVLADPRTAAKLSWIPFTGNLGNSVSFVILLNVISLILLRSLPETAGRELESISG
jgi:MFS family permease